jgi:hypothetical protein
LKIDRAGRAAQGGCDDEAEDVQDAGDETREDVVPTRWAVALRVEGMREKPDDEEDRRYADRDNGKGDHEPPSAAELHESLGDHCSAR